MNRRQAFATRDYLLPAILSLTFMLGCEQKPRYIIQSAKPAPQNAPLDPESKPQAPEGEVALKGVGVMLRRISIPWRENGYHQFDSQLIKTQSALDDFLAEVERQPHWNKKKTFIDNLTEAEIDFDHEALLLIRNTQGSGSVRVWLETPRLADDEIGFQVNRTNPAFRTMDMAYYCYATVLPKRLAKAVRVKGAATSQRYIFNDAGERTLREGHMNDLTFLMEPEGN